MGKKVTMSLLNMGVLSCNKSLHVLMTWDWEERSPCRPSNATAIMHTFVLSWLLKTIKTISLYMGHSACDCISNYLFTNNDKENTTESKTWLHHRQSGKQLTALSGRSWDVLFVELCASESIVCLVNERPCTSATPIKMYRLQPGDVCRVGVIHVYVHEKRNGNYGVTYSKQKPIKLSLTQHGPPSRSTSDFRSKLSLKLKTISSSSAMVDGHTQTSLPLETSAWRARLLPASNSPHE